MKLLAFLFRRSPAGLPLAIFLGLASGAASTGLLAVVHQALNNSQMTHQAFLLWAFVALCVLGTVLRVLSQYLLVELSQRLVLELRMHLARRVFATPLAQIEAHGTARLLASLIDDVNMVGEGLVLIPFLSLTIAIVLGALSYLAWLSLPLFAVLLLVMTAGIFTYWLPFLHGDRFFRRAREEKDQLFDHLRSLTDGIRELKLHRRRQNAFLALLESSGRTMHRFYTISQTIFGVAASWGHLLFFVVIGVLIFAVPGWVEVDRSILMGYALALLYLMNPLQAILNSMPLISRAGVALDKVERLGLALAPPPSRVEVAEHRKRLGRWQRLELCGVRYAYGKEDQKYRFTFGPVDMAFEPGELVFIVGGNGSGKTTFVKLLTGLYSPDEGQVRLGGEVIEEDMREDYRQFFSLVFADPYIFPSLLGLETPGLDEQARSYLRKLDLDEKVEVEDGVLSTTSLSQGQRKRLALLTAYLEDRPAYIFDEWAADQDPTFRQIFYDEILPELKARGKTVFVISHDDRYYGVADRILKLESGNVISDGSPGGLPTTFSRSEDPPAPAISAPPPPAETRASAGESSGPGMPNSAMPEVSPAPPRPLPGPATNGPRIGVLRRAAVGTAVLLTLLILSSFCGLLWLWLETRASLPILEGEQPLAGLDAPVRVERDALGIPTLVGQTRLDIARATGFVHAQDRFFQMDLLRRRSAGELAELFGKAALEVDRTLRRHRFRTRAEGYLHHLRAEHRALLEAYAEGVNAGLQELDSPPFEYLFLRTDPRAWQPVDSVLVLLTMFVQLQEPDAATERAWSLMADLLPRELVDFLLPVGTRWDAALDATTLPLAPIPGPEVVNLRGATESASHRLTPSGPLPDSARRVLPGSNGWALSSSRTGSGAILANDLHLDLAVPNIWYRLAMSWGEGVDGRQVIGVTLPGVPATVLGSNTHISWGLTNSVVDTSDLIVVEVDGSDGGRYRTPEGLRTFQTHEEVIRIRGGGTHTLSVRETIWGPVIAEDHRGRPLVMRWTAHLEEAVDLEILGLETARTADEALAIAGRSGVPALNFLVADAEGRIAWTIIGRLPRRVNLPGRTATSWGDGSRGWDGLLAPSEAPRLLDPEGGLLWNANNRSVGGEELHLLGDNGYQLGARATQIRDALRALDQPTPQSMLALQMDDHSRLLLDWRDLMVDLLPPEATTGHPRREELRDLLTAWDGRASVDSAAYRFIRTFRILLSREVLPPLVARCREADPAFNYADNFRQVEGPLWRLVSEQPPHLLPPSVASWNGRHLGVLDHTIDLIGDSAPLAARTWGQRNISAIQHPLSLGIPGLGQFLDMKPEPLPGGDHTPKVQDPSFGASLRMVVSPGREAQGFFHMPGGQSGHPMSPHYRDGHRAWAQGEPTPFLPGPPTKTLRLLPATPANPQKAADTAPG